MDRVCGRIHRRLARVVGKDKIDHLYIENCACFCFDVGLSVEMSLNDNKYCINCYCRRSNVPVVIFRLLYLLKLILTNKILRWIQTRYGVNVRSVSKSSLLVRPPPMPSRLSRSFRASRLVSIGDNVIREHRSQTAVKK